MSELPEEVVLFLGPDVTQWLYAQAAEKYQGDVIKAMRVNLKVAMIIHQNPERPWAGVEYEDGTSRRYRSRR